MLPSRSRAGVRSLARPRLTQMLTALCVPRTLSQPQMGVGPQFNPARTKYRWGRSSSSPRLPTEASLRRSRVGRRILARPRLTPCAHFAVCVARTLSPPQMGVGAQVRRSPPAVESAVLGNTRGCTNDGLGSHTAHSKGVGAHVAHRARSDLRRFAQPPEVTSKIINIQ